MTTLLVGTGPVQVIVVGCVGVVGVVPVPGVGLVPGLVGVVLVVLDVQVHPLGAHSTGTVVPTVLALHWLAGGGTVPPKTAPQDHA